VRLLEARIIAQIPLRTVKTHFAIEFNISVL